MPRKLLNHLTLARANLLFNRLDSDSLFSRIIANLLLHLFADRADNERYYNYFSKNFTFDHNALWSYPNSGNQWVRFISEYLTGCPTRGGIGNPNDTPIYLRTFPSEEHPLAHVNPENPFIFYKSHWAYKITSRSAIFLIIRGYRELISRSSDIKGLVSKAFGYLDLIATYDRFSGNKMVIYYEDLLTHPEREISRIRYLFNGSGERLKTLMDNYDYYAELLKQRKSRDGRPCSATDDIRFHQKKLSEQDLLARKNVFQAMLATKQYKCVRPYLARYE